MADPKVDEEESAEKKVSGGDRTEKAVQREEAWKALSQVRKGHGWDQRT
jgi:hypothetical protein